jgi:hypothetical protein
MQPFVIADNADVLRYLFSISDISIAAHVIDNEIEDLTIELGHHIPTHKEWLANHGIPEITYGNRS